MFTKVWEFGWTYMCVSGCMCVCVKAAMEKVFDLVYHYIPDGINHLQTHIDTIGCMLWPRDGQARDAVVTIAQDFDAKTVIFL